MFIKNFLHNLCYNIYGDKVRIFDFLDNYDIYNKNGYCELDTFEEAILISNNFFVYQKDIIIIKNNLYQASLLYNELLNYLQDSEVVLFGFDESLIVETIASSNQLSQQRIDTLIAATSKKPKIIITHTLGLIRPIIEKDSYFKKIMNFTINDKIDLEKLKKDLVNSGYSKVSKVNFYFEFSIRGNVIDIYSSNYNMPIRIDTFDNTIESIKTFDINTQRSRISLNECMIYPASIYDYEIKENIYNKLKSINSDEDILDALSSDKELNIDLFFSRYYYLCDKKSSIIDYLKDLIIIHSSHQQIEDSEKLLLNESYEYLHELFLEKKALDNIKLFYTLSGFSYKFIDIKTYRSNLNEISLNLYPLDKLKTANDYIEDIKKRILNNYKVYLFLNKDNEIKHIKNVLEDNEIEYSENDNENKVIIVKEKLSRGFILSDKKTIFYSSQELFLKKKNKNRFINKYENAVDINNLSELQENDYIVHNVHGIGQYKGLIQLKVDNIEKDFLHIVYRNNEKLYIPIDQFNLIKKYSSQENIIPKISVLGGSDWKKTKLKVQKKIEDMIDELLELYAIREKEIGHQFIETSEIEREFSDDFEFELTPDQAQAIKDVEKDMESKYVMDRLICGDVGYGKTEVALRAILKAVVNKKQAAFLCPTTILARQHYLTLMERFEKYPINIVQVSRNTSTKVFNQIKEDLKNNRIDVVVGTHKLLNKELQFSDLGLLVVDEEQRFGVKDKEKIKQIKNNVDVLTLSATPIPRTLQMSLSGLRKMSLLQTPPLNRVPIQTYVVEKNKFIIKEAIERELARKGQVFYLYNKTKNIEDVTNRLRLQFKDSKVAYIHGQMSKNDINDVMEQFDNNEYSILVCTTIIETGIDIPNANTIIIEDANKFGLAQLYQIKGRVGRSDRVGYAYLMYQKDKTINENALKRLQAIKEFNKLGSGYKIALRDLAIRGAGDLLGKSQAGNIESVGYDLYLEMLQEEIEKRNNTYVENEEIEVINLKNTGYIPKDYELDDTNKISLYQKIYEVKDLNRLDSVIEEINDLYGKLPNSIMDIIEKRKFEILINNNKKIKIHEDKVDNIVLQLDINIKDKTLLKEVFSFLDLYSRFISIDIKFNKLYLTVKKISSYLKSINEVIEEIEKYTKGE